MKETKVVNKYKNRFDVYIGRGSSFGNPFEIGIHGDRNEVIKKYKQWFVSKLAHDQHFKKEVENLRGKVLGCFCKPQNCHGDVIVDYLEGSNDT